VFAWFFRDGNTLLTPNQLPRFSFGVTM